MSSRLVVFFPAVDFIGGASFVFSLREALKRSRWEEQEFVVVPTSLQKHLEERGRSLPIGTIALMGVSPTPSGIKQALSLQTELSLAGFPSEYIVRMGFGQGMPGSLSSDIVEESVGELKHWIAYDPALLIQSELEGIPVFDLAPKSRLAQHILFCAELITTSAQNLIGEGNGDPIGLHDYPEWGPVGKWLRDETVNEIMMNGTDRMFIEKNGNILMEPSPFHKNEEIQRLIDAVTGPAGRRADFSSPLCDLRLKDGSRVNIVLPPISLNGPVLTIRKFRPHLKGMDDLLALDALTPQQADRLKQAIAERQNIVLAGNAGAGKTTLLNILSTFIPAHERIITIEDTAELQLSNPHVISLESRQKNTEGQGEISLNDLVVNALRMRPDRLIIGECRGREVLSLLQAMNTGHDGALTTLHANSAADAIQRLEGMVLLGAPRWPIEVVRQQLASALDLIVYMKREGGRRAVQEIVRMDEL